MKSVLLAALALVAACGSSGPTVEAIAIATQAPPPSGEIACMAALVEGTLVQDPRSGLGVMFADGTVMAIMWPNGWHGAATNPVALIDAAGKVVAHVGDHVAIGGGFGLDDRLFHACPSDIRVG